MTLECVDHKGGKMAELCGGTAFVALICGIVLIIGVAVMIHNSLKADEDLL